jgi:hypothetical protein
LTGPKGKAICLKSTRGLQKACALRQSAHNGVVSREPEIFPGLSPKWPHDQGRCAGAHDIGLLLQRQRLESGRECDEPTGEPQIGRKMIPSSGDKYWKAAPCSIFLKSTRGTFYDTSHFKISKVHVKRYRIVNQVQQFWWILTRINKSYERFLNIWTFFKFLIIRKFGGTWSHRNRCYLRPRKFLFVHIIFFCFGRAHITSRTLCSLPATPLSSP